MRCTACTAIHAWLEQAAKYFLPSCTVKREHKVHRHRGIQAWQGHKERMLSRQFLENTNAILGEQDLAREIGPNNRQKDWKSRAGSRLQMSSQSSTCLDL
jgi:hypothetical protein